MKSNNLNETIKFDLHIHSSESAYKENSDIVKYSDINHIDTLLDKLNESGVALFSITDHNRFNVPLYEALDQRMMSGSHPNVKGLLAGVEFDVCMEDGKSKCHIITIFNAQNNPDNYKKIYQAIEGDKLTKPEEYYDKNRFESIIKRVNLDVILIASQRESLDRKQSTHNSLSGSINSPYEVIEAGYISALEFQKTSVEGILLDNLKRMDLSVALFAGSDCHEWEAYPKHDHKNGIADFRHSTARMLPTFKGLLMAVTSPHHRFGSAHNLNKTYFEEIIVNGNVIPLANGINAIIGENGSGKTTLISTIIGGKKEKYIKDLIKRNAIEVHPISFDHGEIRAITQGEIIKKFNERMLFADNDTSFKSVDTEDFVSRYKAYAEELYSTIQKQIKAKTAIDSLKKNALEYYDDNDKASYYITVDVENGFSDIVNKHHDEAEQLRKIIDSLTSLKTTEYYITYQNNLMEAINILESIYESIKLNSDKKALEIKIKNIIHEAINNYSVEIGEVSSSHDKEVANYNKQRKKFINTIVESVRHSTEDIQFPDEVTPMSGESIELKNGFKFTKETAYNGKNMADDFLETMFVQEYRSLKRIQTIHSLEMLSDAVKNCGSIDRIKEQWEANLDKFIKSSILQTGYVLNADNNKIGGTLGEISLTYYKFILHDENAWSILIVDQPEDNISNNNISGELVKLLSSMRNSKQIVFVTHNPLLVVNLDVDNVIFVENNDGELKTTYGCLEYGDDECDILDIVARHMDGGRKAIEKRLKVYGKGN